MRRFSPRGAVIWVLWLAIFAAATAAMLAGRGALGKAHVELVFLLVVLGGSASGGRPLGVTLAAVSFVAFDWFFLPPYGTIVIRNPLDWLVLVAFLITSLVAAQLLYLARRERAALERGEALREADRLKDALLAAVSHDLRTPLTTIKALAHELRGDERAVVIEEEADRLNRLVGDLLDAARLNGGSIPLDLQVNAVDDLIGATVQQFSGRPDRHRVHATLDAPDDLLLARFDFVQALRVLTNLVDNALKYSPVDAPVGLAAGREGAWVTIRVSDHGPGIAADDRERIFAPFFRAGATASARSGPGSVGLGLAIARGLALAQGGTLEVTPHVGGGSVFTLRLPAT